MKKEILQKYAYLFMAVGMLIVVAAEAAENLLGVTGHNFVQLVRVAGSAGFLGGLVVSVDEIRRRMASLTSIEGRVQALQQPVTSLGMRVEELEQRSRQLVEAVKDASPLLAARDLEKPDVLAHVKAAAATLAENARESLAPLRDLQRLHRRDDRATVRVLELHVVSTVLDTLVEALPRGSIWMGISRLTTGWRDDENDPVFVRFKNRIAARAKAGEIAVFRVYSAPSDDRLADAMGEIASAAESGINVRCDVGDGTDFTLLWVPAANQTPTIHSTADGIVNVTPDIECRLCVCVFATSNSRMVDSVHIEDGSARSFSDRYTAFQHIWRRGREPGATKPA